MTDDRTPSPLAAALAAFQAELPRIGKANIARVRSDKGNYEYTYADLSDISAKVLPLLARHGMSFSAKPTLFDGKFVLQYTLRHVEGESDTGYYPLTASGTPQQVGSAITYARRYALSAVTGIVPDEDDDGAAAEQAHAQPPQRQQESQHRPAHEPSMVDAARDQLRSVCAEHAWDLGRVAALFSTQYSEQLRDASDVNRIIGFTKNLFAMPESELKATNGTRT